MKNIFLLFLSLYLASCTTPTNEKVTKKDTSITINLNTIYEAPGRGILILYPISEMEDSLRAKIRFPNLTDVADTAFAEIYFTGKNHNALENNILVLVGNHNSPSPLFWVDEDNDLDLSEEREPILFSENWMDVKISDISNQKLFHTIRFHKPEASKKSEIKEMIDLYIAKGKNYMDFFMDERRNIRVGDFIYNNDSLRIGIIDWDVNGSYNDQGIDRLVFGKFGDKISGTEESEGAVILDSITYFQGKTNAFEVLEVSANGQTLIIRPTLSENLNDRIQTGDFISDYSFKLLTGKETSFKKLMDGKKYLYINFWASWCSGCHQEVDDLKKIYSDYQEKFTVISLNYNEDIKKIQPFLDKKEIQWLNGFSTNEINEELLIQGLPRNILIDPSGKIIEMNIHPSILLKRIDQY